MTYQSAQLAPKSFKKTALDWVVSTLVFLAIAAAIWWSGFRLNTVATDSMSPTYAPTDIVLTLGPNILEPGVGDAVVFDAELFGTPIPPHIHRIVGENEDGTWQTQGDNAEQPDPWSITSENVHGVAIVSFPGWILRSPVALGFLVFLVAVAAFWPREGDEELNEELDELPPVLPKFVITYPGKAAQTRPPPPRPPPPRPPPPPPTRLT